MASKLELVGVEKAYGDRTVLDGLDLVVDEHEVVCLIGPSGCGKSTLVRCIDLLDPIDNGDIRLDGHSITAKGVDANQVRRRIGIVFQSFNLFPHMTVLDNVTLGPRRAHGVPRAEAETQAGELLERFGLGDKADEFPNRISGGQNQRAAIVRALMGDPEILLLDEVTSALDPELVGEVLAVIRELASEGLTMVLATHEMGFARDVANRVCFLHEGRVLESGPPAELFASPQAARTKQFLARVSEAGRL
ncbi:MAG: amino acid ABC transporter ATP-binding protein [Actinomycetia bacterium]|nr:amino acid ABC transporter ATP-binding protein [Actinomycetes bacterium]MCP5033927.1 amino acid ABC transporter ATP-binding protein [Actinomycetes bacterium]